MSNISPIIATLDRRARELNLDLQERGVNRRILSYNDLTYDYSPNGDVLRVKMYKEPMHTLVQITNMDLEEVDELFRTCAGLE